MEREGEVRGRGRRRGGEMRKGIVIGGMVIGLLMGCNNGLAELEKKNSFFDSVVKIGQGFQEIFGIFGNAIGNELGFNAIKPEDNRNEVKKHFDTLGDGLKKTKDKLDELSKKIVATPHADTKGVEAVIQNASAVIVKLMTSITKLAGSIGSTQIADGVSESGSAPAEEDSVKTVIAEVQAIVDTAEKSGINIEKGNDGGSKVVNGNGPKAVVHSSQAAAGDANKLANEVAKADPWAMIDKIKNAKTKKAAPADNDDAGQLATATDASNSLGTAKSNADLAAAVALKAMTKGGKFAQPASNEDGALKAAVSSAVNKVLGVLDVIIKKIVNNELDKIKEEVKKIEYSETAGTNATEASTSNK